MNKGFTLVELLAVLIILSLLLVITVPAYTSVYSGIRRNSYENKISMVQIAASKYADKIKDEIKEAGTNCLPVQVSTLIEQGYLTSESETEAAIYSPEDNTKMDSPIYLCYIKKDFKVDAIYAKEFDASKAYFVGDKVHHNGSFYLCKYKYNNNGGIDAVKYNNSGTSVIGNYFEKITI